MLRARVQFHWTNASAEPYADFADFLASLQRDKRKKIQQERRSVADAGVTFSVHEGAAIDDARLGLLLPLLHAHLPRAPLDALPDARLLRRAWRARWPSTGCCSSPRVAASAIAASLIALDRERRAAFGRYWGATEHVRLPALRGLLLPAAAWCIEPRLSSASKAARRASTRWRAACCRCRPRRRTGWRTRRSRARSTTSCSPSATALAQYVDELNERLPFRRDALKPGCAALKAA